MEAIKHPDEAARLAALWSYNILDTPREKDFDDVVHVVAAQCDAPISVVNLIDERRQWFKAETGLGVRETPLETSICAHAILQEDFMLVEDTLADSRFCDNPLCMEEPNLRFYAGALLRSDSGHPIGTLCVLDTEPRTLNADQITLIKVMAAQVMTQLSLRRLLQGQMTAAQESAHRTKNLMAIVSAMFRQTRRNSKDMDDLARRFDERIGNLAQVQEQLALSQWEAADLGILLRTVLREIGGEDAVGINITSETVHVSAHAANNIAMALFELATNSLKYGALSVDEGKVDVTVSKAGGEVALDWRETGGPPVTSPDKPGMGLFLIRDACPAALNGKASLEFAPAGVTWRLRFPAETNG